MSSPELSEHADIHADNDWALKWASYGGHVEVVKYLLTGANLVERADIHSEKDAVLIIAVMYQKNNVIQFLLHDMQMKVSPVVYDQLAPAHRQTLNHLVAKRDLFFTMNAQLEQKPDRVNLHGSQHKI